MTESTTQISASISVETKNRLERYARARGLKKGFLIESALLHHIAALESLPADVIIPSRLIVSRSSGERILDLIEQPPAPTEAMEALFDSNALEEGRLD
jgi:uncharacterized protein (DUF1778 family)